MLIQFRVPAEIRGTNFSLLRTRLIFYWESDPKLESQTKAASNKNRITM
jgi:hypothetical protein